MVGKQFALALLPVWVSSRLGNYRDQPLSFHWKKVVLCLIAIVLGSSSHVVWDAHTHITGWGVLDSPLLMNSVHILDYHLPVYKLIQHGSSVLGLPLLLAGALFALVKRKPSDFPEESNLGMRYKVAVISVFIAIPVLVFSLHCLFGATLFVAI
jgi:hypothetical protein